MIRKFYNTHETALCMILIGAYVIVNSFCIQNFGTADYKSALVNIVFAAALYALTAHLNRTVFYGLTSITRAKDYLFLLC